MQKEVQTFQQRCQKAEKERDTLAKERTFALERAERAEKELPDFVAQKNNLLMQVCFYQSI